MTTETTVTMRRCIGSKTFGIEPHEAPISEFPVQPSQKDGLGRMCKPHWRRYTNALREAAVARRSAAEEATLVDDPRAGSEVQTTLADETREPEPPEAHEKRRATTEADPTGEAATTVDVA